MVAQAPNAKSLRRMRVDEFAEFFVTVFIPRAELASLSQRPRVEQLQRVVSQWQVLFREQFPLPEKPEYEFARALPQLHAAVEQTDARTFLVVYQTVVLPSLFPPSELPRAYERRLGSISRYLAHGSRLDPAGGVLQADAEYVLKLLRLGEFTVEAGRLQHALAAYHESLTGERVKEARQHAEDIRVKKVPDHPRGW